METNRSKRRQIMGEKIRIIRHLSGLTQTDFGKKLGFSSSGTISLIEAGKRGIGQRELSMIEKEFDIPVAALVCETPLGVDEVLALQTMMKMIKKKMRGNASPFYESIMALLTAAREQEG